MLLCACFSLSVSTGAPSRKSSKKAARSSKLQESTGRDEGRGGNGGEGSSDEASNAQQQVTFPVVVDDTRFFNNMTHERTGPPLKISLADENQYSRIYFPSGEGQLTTTLLEELLPTDTVLDLGAEIGVFSLTAARRGVRSVTAVEADMEHAVSLEKSVDINGLHETVLVLTWLPSSHQGYASCFRQMPTLTWEHSPRGTRRAVPARLVNSSPRDSCNLLARCHAPASRAVQGTHSPPACMLADMRS